MAAAIVFADNCLLVNLAHIGRLDLARQLLGDKITWTQQVEYETSRSCDYVSGLRDVYTFMPNAIVPSAAERQDTFAIRTSFAKPGEIDQTRHLGEAETCAVIHKRFEADSPVFFATEDGSAAAYALRHGWRVLSTKIVLELSVRRGLLTVTEANLDLRTLLVMPRGVRGFPPDIEEP